VYPSSQEAVADLTAGGVCPAVAALEYNLRSKGESATVCAGNGIELRMQKLGPAPHVRCAGLLPS